MTISTGCTYSSKITTDTAGQEPKFEMMDDTMRKISFDSETFYVRYQEALQEGRPILIVLSERPFCNCFGDKEIMKGVTLNAYNTSAVELMKEVTQCSNGYVETILIDRSKLEKKQIAQYIDLKERLGATTTQIVAVVSKDGSVTYLSGDKIVFEDVLHALDLSDSP